VRRWPLVVVLWLIAAVFGLAFALASGVWLTDALDGSLATRTLFRQLDADVFVDLWYHHREGLRVLLVLAAVLAVVHTVLWWWLHGVLICALQRPAGETVGVWTEGLGLAPVMAQLFTVAMAVLALFSTAVGGAAYALLRSTRSSPSALIWEGIIGGAAVMWLLGYVFLVAVHDHARLRACRVGGGALPAYGWALGFVARGGERAFPLACALQLSGVTLWGAYHAVSLSVPMTAVLGLTGSLVLGEAFVLARLWVRVWFFAAQNELQT
jgi:hypothetical protein